MKRNIQYKLSLKAAIVALMAMTCAVPGTDGAHAGAGSAHHPFLGGPWEIVVQIGRQGQNVRFPVEASDEDKPENINKVLPIVGTAIRIRLKQYLPDLKWQTAAVEDANGGIVAKLRARGEDFNQEILLSADDPSRQSMISTIGGITLVELADPNTIKKLLPKLADANAVGILSIRPRYAQSPLEYAAIPGQTIILPKSGYKLSILSYIPHYSIDTKTKEVTSRSNEPVNPAIKVRVEGAEKAYEQWLWAKFPSFAHEQKQDVLDMTFTSLDPGSTEGNYLLVVSRGSQPWVLSSAGGKVGLQRAAPEKSYPFANKEYSFSIEEIIDHAVINTTWSNDSQQLLHPAFVAVVEENGTEQEAVLELDKPSHKQTGLGKMVLLFRRQPTPMEK
ncbi:MAG: hypothetical protein ACYTBJ_07115 [Planctomycetota bacterium]|jgi:hypothetical protein